MWFNVELAKKHPDCLEYIVVHEMAHLLRAQATVERFTKADGQVLCLTGAAVVISSTVHRWPRRPGDAEAR
jgi:hypothetical protein